jgi:hypothetical protein
MASARSRCSNSCSARSFEPPNDGAASASPNSSSVRSPPSERNSIRNTRLRSRRRRGHPSPKFPANPALDPRHLAPGLRDPALDHGNLASAYLGRLLVERPLATVRINTSRYSSLGWAKIPRSSSDSGPSSLLAGASRAERSVDGRSAA